VVDHYPIPPLSHSRVPYCYQKNDRFFFLFKILATMPGSIVHLVYGGLIVAAMIIGPRKLLPRMAQYLKQAREVLDKEETLEKLGQSTANTFREIVKQKQSTTNSQLDVSKTSLSIYIR
jgi:hypothetical protein